MADVPETFTTKGVTMALVNPGLTPSDLTHWVSRGGAILVERSEWPLVVCHMMRVPSDREVVSYLEQRERLLDQRNLHVVLIQHLAGYVEPLEHALLREAFQRVHKRRLERFCLGEAFVRAQGSSVHAHPRAPQDVRMPVRTFDDVPSARAWLRARFSRAPS